MRFVGANAIDQAAGMAISRAISVEPPAMIDRVHGMMQIVAALLHGGVVLSVQSKNRNDGGTAKASSSVLKLASIIQRIGKKIRSPTIQARDVAPVLCVVETLRAMRSHASRLLADDADEEEGDDVGDHHRDQPPAEAAPTSNSISACR